MRKPFQELLILADFLQSSVTYTSASAATAAAVDAAIATNYISKSLLNNDSPCGFQKFVLDATDSTMSEDNWVTITVQPDGVLSFFCSIKNY